MARASGEKHDELEAFWRFHHDQWVQSTLNQREYCDLHGLPLKRFGNWRAVFKGDAKVRKAGLLYRRGGLSHMSSHMPDREIGPVSPGYIPSRKAVPDARRNFNRADKLRIVAETEVPGASLSAVARRHGIGTRLLFRWKKDLVQPAETLFLPAVVSEGPEPASDTAVASPVSTPALGPIIVERSTPGIEVELFGGRRVRFERGTDPETVRAMIAVLEGRAP